VAATGQPGPSGLVTGRIASLKLWRGLDRSRALADTRSQLHLGSCLGQSLSGPLRSIEHRTREAGGGLDGVGAGLRAQVPRPLNRFVEAK
jgi:hypothetical protein